MPPTPKFLIGELMKARYLEPAGTLLIGLG
jgi:hypothetical protein